MATAETSKPTKTRNRTAKKTTARAKESPPPSPSDPLWHGKKIRVVGVTGEFESGKSMFGLLIDPNCYDYDMTDPADSTTIVWDTEGSTEPYEDMFNFDRRDVTAGLHDGYRPMDLFQAWRKNMLAVEPGQFRVGVLDTIEEIEAGLADWVREYPTDFGHTAGQYAKMEGLFWGDVKTFWQKIIDSELKPRFETFVFTAHLKAEWNGKSPTGKRVPKGKETLMKLATLYLELERKRIAKGKKQQRAPSGIVLKSRLSVRHPDDPTMIVPMLPPRLPEATPNAIRQYVLNPPDFDNLKTAERPEDQSLTDDQKLILENNIANKKLETATVELSRAETIRKAAARKAEKSSGNASPADKSADAADATKQRTTRQAANHRSTNGRATRAQHAQIVSLSAQAFNTQSEFSDRLKEFDLDLDTITREDAAGLIQGLEKRVNERQQQSSQPAGKSGQKNDITGDSREASDSAPCTESQIKELNRVATSIDLSADAAKQLIGSYGVDRGPDLTMSQADDLIGKLKIREVEEGLGN